MVCRKSALSRLVKLLILAWTMSLLGTVSWVPLSLRMRVERGPMSSTVPLSSPKPHEVTYLEGLVREERHAADEILQRGLCGETDDEAADAGPGQQPECRDADLVGADEDDERDADDADDSRDQAQQMGVVASCPRCAVSR